MTVRAASRRLSRWRPLSPAEAQFATLAALGGLLLLRERLASIQLAGVATVAAGVAVLSVLQG
jgi:drug/metabolite transporter (DMT)-like permease